MIYEFALEPELVAAWHDRGAYRFFDGKFGIGGRRIASAFPSADKWRQLVLRALDDAFQHSEPQEGACAVCAKKQGARKRVDALLGYLRKEMVERKGAMPGTWRDGVVREHGVRRFQGILAVSGPPPPLCADDIDESTAVWNPPAPATPRQVADLLRALEPVLRFCSEVRVVDPYIDASLSEFAEPLSALMGAVQQRAAPASVKLELHTGVNRKRVSGASTRHDDIAREIADDCRKVFAPVLKRGTQLRVFVWSEAVARAEKIHNRYVLTNVGSICVPTGLDRAHPSAVHTDDLTLLSREQHQLRWSQYCEGSKRLKCVLGPETVAGTA